MSGSNDNYALKRTIVSSIKDLERTDYVDICTLIKSSTTTIDMFTETPRGTFVNLDRLEDAMLVELHHMISTKLQRISGR